MWVNTPTKAASRSRWNGLQRLLAEGNEAEDSRSTDLRASCRHGLLFLSGQLLEAREQGNRVLALYDPQRAGRWMQLTGQDLRTVVGSARLSGPGCWATRTRPCR